MPKPSDLLLNIIDFLGILVPGAVLTVLYGDALLELVGAPKLSSLPAWIPGFLFAYIAGHALLGLSVPLNRLAQVSSSCETLAYFDAAKEHVSLPTGVEPKRKNVFYAAFSYLRLNADTALAEVERQAAEYKLFRSLILVAVLDVPLSILLDGLKVERVIAALVVLIVAAYRFHFLYNWTHRLTFDFFLQSRSSKDPDPSR